MYISKWTQVDIPLDNEITFQCCYLNLRPQLSNELSCCLAPSLGHSLIPMVCVLSSGKSHQDSGAVRC